jgi:signal transduction histidine kinase
MDTSALPVAPLTESDDSRLFRRQESTLVALCLATLAALVLVHLGFSGTVGVPNSRVLVAIALFFLAQTIEFFVLQDHRVTFNTRARRLYGPLSVGLKLLAGATIGVLGGVEDSHYSVLLVLPIVSASFRFPIVWTLVAASLGGVLTFTQLALYYRRHPPAMPHEFYEAATVVLIYFVVGIVVANLVGQLRRDRRRLLASFAELESTRDRLVTEEKLAAIGRLSSGIAHEIRNPVAMILSSIERVRSPRSDAVERDEMLGIVVGEARRLEQLAGDFLNYAHPRPVELRPTGARDLLEYLAGLARARAGRRVSRCASWRCGWHARVDPFQMQQALLNLLVNALEAAAPGTSITLGVRLAEAPPGWALFFVEIGGGPIPPETAERLFEPFFTTRQAGTGLGLAIARNIARAHGGDLTLAGNSATCVRFELSVQEPAAGADHPVRG